MIENNYDIFKYLNKNDNTLLNDMKGHDLIDLLTLLDKYKLEYRDNLGLDDNITFGTEIEFEKADINKIRNMINDENTLNRYRLVTDLSLVNGEELVSPILHDKINDWDSLKIACNILDKNATIFKNAGGHIHIGLNALGTNDSSWVNFIKLWATYENVIFRFAYNNFLEHRDRIWEYAFPMSEKYSKLLRENKQIDIKLILESFDYTRFNAVNIQNVDINNQEKQKNTIEFRCANGTLDYIIWQNNINLFTKLLLYSKSNNFNDDIITKRLLSDDNINLGLNFYSEIFLNQALELADLLFDNNLDKIYFLRQYLKSFDSSNVPLAKAKTFTMRK